MVKRKRESEIDRVLGTALNDLHRALKTVKGFERQRMSKRMRDRSLDDDKKKRIQQDVLVLKSLDLTTTARAYLTSSLGKIKAIAEHPELPASVREGVPKPELSEDERAALHRVTSSLWNRPEVRKVTEQTIEAVCDCLRIKLDAARAKNGKGKKDVPKAKDRSKTNKDDRDDEAASQPLPRKVQNKRPNPTDIDISDSEEDDSHLPDRLSDESDSEEEEPRSPSRRRRFVDEDDDMADDDSVDEDELDAQYGHLVVGSGESDDSDDDLAGSDGDGMDESSKPRNRSPSVDFDSEESDGESESEEEESPSESESPRKKKRQAPSRQPVNGSTFLPSLMGGYVSGSESEASDLDDIAPRKHRLGQRQRQAIWEKKYGTKAKHIQKQAQSASQPSWDAKRGAVYEEGGARKPWKAGVVNPLVAAAQAEQRQQSRPGRNRSDLHDRPHHQTKPHTPTTTTHAEPTRRPKRDDEGPLHPSWEARKKAKEAQKINISAMAPANKIVFDD